jgi:acetyl esterase/lipase
LAIASLNARAAVEAIPTFHSLGLYWSNSGGSPDTVCNVRFRKNGSTDWRAGYPLWFDARHVGAGTDAERPANEYRGSLVHLEPGTTYEIELSLRDTDTRALLTASTWSETFPIARTIHVPANSKETLVISESGSPSGYILYTGEPGTSATIDVGGEHPSGIQVNASYVIIRGLTIKNAGRDGIRIEDGLNDIVIENCDISGWGRIDTDASAGGKGSETWGMYGDAGIYSNSKTLKRVIIQRNRIHHPRTDSNNWSERREKYNTFHPRGPNGIYLIDTAGHHIVRYNEIGSDDDHMYNDIVAGDANFSWRGFPNCDSDIYGNRLSHAWDDGIEAEGGNRNVRIWGNYISQSYTGIATAATSVGPIYIWRNVYDTSRKSEAPNDAVEHGPFAKLGDHPRFGGGRRYFFHNTLLQRPPPEGSTRTQGAGGALAGGTSERPMVDVWTRNNVWHLSRPDRSGYSAGHPLTTGNNFDYDLHTGTIRLPGNNSIGPHMIKGTPEYAPGHGAENRDGGRYSLAAGSPGFDGGEVLPTFNDGFTGKAPDLGAHEAGTSPLEFGVNAYRITHATHVYKRVGDLEIEADVHRLNDTQVRPVVVWIHGGALIMGGRERINQQLQQLLRAGIIVVSIDYRLAPETKLPAIIGDVEDAFKWVRERGPALFHADPDRIGVWGSSAGGYLTLTAGFRVKPRPQVLVSFYGYGDLIGDWYSQPSPHARHHQSKMTETEARRQVSGPPIANNRDRQGRGDAFYQFARQKGIWPKEISGWDPAREPENFFPFMAVKNVTRDYPPTLLLHGTSDTDVPYEQSTMMAAELQKHGVTHRLISLPNGEHGFDGADRAAIEEANRAAIEFTKQHLGVK